MEITFTNIGPLAGAVVIGAELGGALSESGLALDRKAGGLIKAALKAKKFEGKIGQFCEVMLPEPTGVTTVLVAGIGEKSALTPLKITEVGGHLSTRLKDIYEDTATLCFDNLVTGAISQPEAAAHMAYGILLRSWRLKKYKTPKPDEKASTERICVMAMVPSTAEAVFSSLKATAEGVHLTRELVTEPCNIIYPETFIERVKGLKALGVKIEVLDEEDMAKLGMNALLGVGQGSEKESRLLVLQWNGTGDKEPPVAIVGKGVTFDTGGISIKPANNMDEMKMDMAGAGVVAGLIHALAARKARVNVVGIAGLVENMPSGSAQRPGDVVKAMSGTTIEILNTDAEGRLVLADALWYAQSRFKPKAMINLATLTGAILVSLGHEFAGLFSNNDDLCEKLLQSGKNVDEPLWRMPLTEAFDKDIESEIADIRNLGTGGLAGSTAAAQFLQRFVNNVPWAHLDIAGTAWIKKDKVLTAKGATAFGVRLLEDFLRKNYETA